MALRPLKALAALAALVPVLLTACSGSAPAPHTTVVASATRTAAGPQPPSAAPSTSPAPGDPRPAPVSPAPASSPSGPAPAPGGKAATASCHRPSVAALAATSGLPAPATWRVRGCTQRWLVLDLSGSAAGCTSLSGDSTLPGCGPKTRLRWFARATAEGWRLVAAGPASGCTDVHDAEPGFPAALCRSLPALPQD